MKNYFNEARKINTKTKEGYEKYFSLLIKGVENNEPKSAYQIAALMLRFGKDALIKNAPYYYPHKLVEFAFNKGYTEDPYNIYRWQESDNDGWGCGSIWDTSYIATNKNTKTHGVFKFNPKHLPTEKEYKQLKKDRLKKAVHKAIRNKEANFEVEPDVLQVYYNMYQVTKYTLEKEEENELETQTETDFNLNFAF